MLTGVGAPLSGRSSRGSVRQKISPLFRLSFETVYFDPIQSSTGIFSYEEDEFWFWNRAKTFQKNVIEAESNSIIENQFATRLTLTFNF